MTRTLRHYAPEQYSRREEIDRRHAWSAAPDFEVLPDEDAELDPEFEAMIAAAIVQADSERPPTPGSLVWWREQHPGEPLPADLQNAVAAHAAELARH